jgi:DMSO/TMAO reductase YedYZ molybdopterin-dependent catalytic subunit
MLALRFALGTPSLQEVIAERLLALLSPAAFEFLLERTYQLGKPLSVLGVSVLLALSGGALGLAWGRFVPRLPDAMVRWRWLTGIVAGVVLWVLASIALVPLLGGGLWGSAVPNGGWLFPLVLLAGCAVYGLALSALTLRVQPAPDAAPPGQGITRRALLTRAITWAAVIGIAGLGIRSLVSGAARMAGSAVSSRDAGVIPPDITPTERFYHVSKNFVDPEVNGATWRLRVEGLMDAPYTLTLDELRSLPGHEEYITLECISNPVGGDLISTAHWRGVRLRDLLERAGLQKSAARVTFASADGYTESLPVQDAMRPEIMVAFAMNGEPLTQSHGFPARVLIPGRYGMKGPKWLERISATEDGNYRGYWEQRGWSDTAVVRATSQVLAPASGVTLTLEPMRVGGVAFSGSRGVSRVEFSADNGKTWRQAELRPALSPYTWRIWTHEWTPDMTGLHKLVVRAYELNGTPQEQAYSNPAPSGATGYHQIDVVVQRVEQG